MYLSKTPLRVSFLGGGTDLPAFYEKHDYGCVISIAINRYVYVGVNSRFDNKIRLAYSRNELIDDVDLIENDRIKATLHKVNIASGIELFCFSDIPEKMGLGGSSAFTVGLLNALYRYKAIRKFSESLAREACEIEIDMLRNPIGKQDQYAAAFGGLNYIRFNADGTVQIVRVLIAEEKIIGLLNNLLFIYLGQLHDSAAILHDVGMNIENHKNDRHLIRVRDLTDAFHDDLANGNIDNFAPYLREYWEIKKKTSSKISNIVYDDLYSVAMNNGACAGKILGAGGGGFFMFYVPEEAQQSFCKKFSSYRICKFDIDHVGTQIAHQD